MRCGEIDRLGKTDDDSTDRQSRLRKGQDRRVNATAVAVAAHPEILTIPQSAFLLLLLLLLLLLSKYHG